MGKRVSIGHTYAIIQYRVQYAVDRFSENRSAVFVDEAGVKTISSKFSGNRCIMVCLFTKCRPFDGFQVH